ncbi:Annexin A2 [Nowakowskiella sp. JEL0078]|nr:Annexin A2 [Nowakowskiella sp. JEL0078]
MSLDFLRPCDPLISPLLNFFRGAFRPEEEDEFDKDTLLAQSEKDMLRLDTVLVQKYPQADKLVRLLASRSHAELVEIARLYVAKTGRSLSDVLGLRLKEKEVLFGELARALVLPAIEYDAYELHYAIEGLGADEDMITEIIVGRNNSELELLKKTYERLFSRSLVGALESEASNIFNTPYFKLIIALLSTPRPEDTIVDNALVDADIGLLFEAGEGRLGADHEIFIEVMTARPLAHVKRVSELYGVKTSRRRDFLSVVKDEFMGDFERAVVKLVLSAQIYEMHVAEQFHKALNGWGRNDEKIIRLLSRYRDQDFLSKVKVAYHARYNRALIDVIQWKTHGNYEKLLAVTCVETRMDRLLAAAVDEVALEGEFGCSMSRFWTLLDSAYREIQSDVCGTYSDVLEVSPLPRLFEKISKNFKLTVISLCTELDPSLKSYIWPFIVQLKDLQFFIREPGQKSFRMPAKIRSSKDKNSVVIANESKEAVNFNSIILKKNLTHLSLHEIADNYGDSLCVFASREQRHLSLIGTNNISENHVDTQFLILSMIGHYRETGISQVEIARTLEMDSRSLHHYVKFHSVKYPIVVKGSLSNLCVHVRFMEFNVGYQEYKKTVNFKSNINSNLMSLASNNNIVADSLCINVERHKLTLLLSEMKNQTIVQCDLISALVSYYFQKVNEIDYWLYKKPGTIALHERKYFQRMLDILVKDGYIERLDIPKPNGLKGFNRCLRLVKMYELKSFGNTSKSIHNTKQKKTPERIADPDKGIVYGEGGILVDLPFEHQIYRLIKISGIKGITSATISRSLSNVGRKLLAKVLEKIPPPGNYPNDSVGAFRVTENHGRERRYRYYSPDAYFKVYTEHNTFATTPSSSSFLITKPQKNKNQKKNPPKKKFVDDGSEVETDENSHDDDVKDIEPTPKRRKLRTRNQSYLTETVDFDKLLEPIEDLMETDPEIDSIVCKVCNSGDNADQMLLCDSCNSGIHLQCTNPPLQTIPENDWFCSLECSAKGRFSQAKINTKPNKIIEMVGDDESEFEIGRVSEHEDVSSENEIEKNKMPEDEPSENESEGSEESKETGILISQIEPLSRKNTKVTKSIDQIRRKNLLLEMVNSKRVIEYNADFIKLLRKTAIEMGDERARNFEIDRRTLFRIAENLRDEKKIQIFVFWVPLVTGSERKSILFLHPSLRIEDEEVQNYRHEIESRAFLSHKPGRAINVKIVPLEVERLVHLKQRFESEKSETVSIQKLNEFEQPDEIHILEPEDFPLENQADSILSSNLNLDLFSDSDQILSEKMRKITESGIHWTVFAQQYGYLTPKFARAKVLHEFLIGYLLENRMFKNDGIFETLSVFFRDLKVDVFLRIFGISFPSKQIDSLIQRDDWDSITLDQLDSETQKELYGKKYRRAKIMILLNILVALNLIIPISSSNDSFRIPYKYQLVYRVPLFDYTEPGRPLLRYYTMSTPETCNEFWHALKFNSIKKNPNINVEIDESQDNDGNRDEDDIGSQSVQNNHLAFIWRSASWNPTLTFKSEERVYLEKFVDRKNLQTPYGDHSKILEISHESEISVPRIKFYYRRIESNFQTKRSTRFRSKGASIQRKLALKMSRLKNKVSQTPVNENPTRGRPTYKGFNAFDHTVMNYEFADKDNESLTIIPDEQLFKSQYLIRLKRNRINWTPKMDKTLMLAYSIVCVHTQNWLESKVIWAPIASLIPEVGCSNYQGAICRRRITILLKKLEESLIFKSYLKNWPLIYQKGIEEGTLKPLTEGTIRDQILNTDLKLLVDYFLSKEKEIE